MAENSQFKRSDYIAAGGVGAALLSALISIKGCGQMEAANAEARAANESARKAANVASAANQIARSAQRQAAELQANSNNLQERLFHLEQLAKEPKLSLLRFRMLGPSRFQATVLNNGERQAAMFAISYQEDPEVRHGTVPTSRVIAPINNMSNLIKISIGLRSQATVEFDSPLVVAPGEIVTFEIAVTTSVSRGSLALAYGDEQSLALGSFDSATAPSPFDAPATGDAIDGTELAPMPSLPMPLASPVPEPSDEDNVPTAPSPAPAGSDGGGLFDELESPLAPEPVLAP